jgi:hypothetical protein
VWSAGRNVEIESKLLVWSTSLSLVWPKKTNPGNRPRW